jgi:hypothetical protein
MADLNQATAEAIPSEVMPPAPAPPVRQPPAAPAAPTPPADYILDPATADLTTIPSFIRNGVDTSKVTQVVEPASQQGAPDVAGTETVAESTPGKIAVYHPSEYTTATRNHEMEHQLQQAQSSGTIKLPGGYELAPFGQHPAAAPEQHESGDPRNYDYGGERGLQQARQHGKTAADFNIEQQADMVSDYKAKQDTYLAKARAGKITKSDQQAMYQTYQAYHPFIQQMASVPRSLAQDMPSVRALLGIGKPPSLAAKPAAPGLPSYAVAGLGVAPADPLLGGQSVALPTSSQAKDSNPTLQQVLKEYPGLAKNFNSSNTTVVFAQGDRAKRGLRERGGLEFWSPSDRGTADFPSPDPGKNVLEIYSDDLKKNPAALKQAIHGDLMHGMASDPYWNNLRSQFMQNFTPQELQRQAQHKTWWEDVNGSKDRNGATYDAYIRGWITNEGQGKQGQKDSGNTMYSPKQLIILQKMQDYLKTGKAQ